MPDDRAFGALTGKVEGYSCPRCFENFGYIFMDSGGALYFCGNKNCLKDDKEASLTLKRENQKKVERDAAREFRIGSNYLNASVNNWHVAQYMHDITSQWLKKPERFLVYQGIPGSGKTYFCAAVGNFLFSIQREPRYIHIRDFVDNCKKTFDQTSQNESGYIRKICSCDVLILDDLGSTMNTEYQKEVLLALIDIRYSFNAPTIITTNLNYAEMKDQLGERITRRVYDGSKILTKDEKYGY